MRIRYDSAMRESLKKIKFCVLTVFSFSFFSAVGGCVQMQISQNEDYDDMKRYYALLASKADQPALMRVRQNTSYIMYRDFDGNSHRVSDEDTERLLYIFSKAKRLPVKDFVTWYKAETRGKHPTCRGYDYIAAGNEFDCYKEDGTKIGCMSAKGSLFIEESRVEEYLQSEILTGQMSLPDELLQELHNIGNKYQNLYFE